MSDSIFDSKLVVCIGAGGVGKTSISAALGIASSFSNRKTLILTVDPAKRLADALGLQHSLGRPTPLPARPNVFAMMFDIEKGWQDLLARELGQSYFDSKLRYNHFFAHLAKELPGSHEFIACDEVYEFLARSDFDLVILDTPPSSQGLQFLDAPQSLVNFFENEFFLGLLRSKSFLSKATFGFLDRSSALINKSLKYFADGSFINEMFDFIYLLRDLYPVLAKRARQFQITLGEKSTQFVVVAQPLSAPLREAAELTRKIGDKNYRSDFLILNQVSPLFMRDDLERHFDHPIWAKEFHRAKIEYGLWEKAREEKAFYQQLITIPRVVSYDHPLERIAKIAQRLQDGLDENKGTRD